MYWCNASKNEVYPVYFSNVWVQFFFRHNMISTWLQWHQLGSRSAWDWCECASCCWFSTVRFRRNLSFLFLLLHKGTQWIFQYQVWFFTPIPLFLLSAFLNGALLDTNHSCCWFYTFRRSKMYQGTIIKWYDPLWENVLSKTETRIEEIIGFILFWSI